MAARRRRAICALLIALTLSACAAVTGPPSARWAPQGWTAATLPELAAALRNGEVSSERLVLDYIDRIERIDRAGPTLQSVLALNPRALAQAREADARRRAGAAPGPLHGVPILLKDNIESADPLPTTAGAMALQYNVSGRDAPLVAGLREAGAVILGKANLSQWANFRSSASISGWSALGGQVRNPHMLDRSPCGSSSGSAVAVAASLAAGAVGTETNGSIVCPSSVNGIVGFKPTVGVVSQRGIVPISPSQDTAGPMTRTVRGAAMLLDAMDGGSAATDYVAALDSEALGGIRVGVLRFAQGANDDVIALFDEAIAQIEAAGATLVEIDAWEHGVETFDSLVVLSYEFKHALNAYLADTPPAVRTRTLAELIEFNEAHAETELALFDQDLFLSCAPLGDLTTPEYLTARAAGLIATRERGIDRLLAEHDLQVLISPSGPLASRIDPINGDVWPEWAGVGWMAAIAGYPHATVPMGTVDRLPVGLSFIAGKDRDAAVLAFAYAYEQRTGLRPTPRFLRDAEQIPQIDAAMSATVP